MKVIKVGDLLELRSSSELIGIYTIIAIKSIDDTHIYSCLVTYVNPIHSGWRSYFDVVKIADPVTNEIYTLKPAEENL